MSITPLYAVPGESGALDNLQQYMNLADTGAAPERLAAVADRLARNIERDPAFHRGRVSGWLHGLDLWEPRRPGRQDLRVAVGCGQTRTVTLRIPRGYTPERAWPLLYLLHTSGGDGPSFLSYADQMLGPEVESFVVAAPTHYRQTGLDAPAPFTADHTAMLRAIRRAVHIDGDRQYAVGYSLGGYTAWTIAYLHAEEIAGAVAIGSTFSVPPAEDGVWKAVLPGMTHLRVLHVWGGRDTLDVPGLDLRSKGSMSDLNRRFRDWTRGMGLPVEDHEVPHKGHGGLLPPRGPLMEILGREREHYPERVDHTFRHIHQGKAYWLEAHTWEGAHWGKELPRAARQTGESDAEALGRAIRETLGRLRGEIDGQTLHVETKHVGDFTVWLGEGMVDWARPVTLVVNGRTLWEGRITPDLDVCLTQATRTRDFDRLRWAGLRVSADRHVTLVDGATKFPPLLPE
jgi:predicted esterase